MPEDEYTRVPVKFIEDLSQKIEQLQHSLRRKQRILNKVGFLLNVLSEQRKYLNEIFSGDSKAAESDSPPAKTSFEFR